MESKTEMTKRSQRQCLLRSTANSSLTSSSRNCVEQENAHHSSLEILMQLPGTCSQDSDFFKLHFSCTITGGPQAQRVCREAEQHAGRELRGGKQGRRRSRSAHTDLRHRESSGPKPISYTSAQPENRQRLQR